MKEKENKQQAANAIQGETGDKNQGCRQKRRIYCYDTEKKKDPELFPFYDMDR